VNWANTMASNADDAADNLVSGDDSAQRNGESGSWDPHQVWLTRVKQPRDGRQGPSSPPAKQSPRATQSFFWTRAAR
jgi:hypothetical protein